MRTLIVRAAALLCLLFDATVAWLTLGIGWLVGLYEQWRLFGMMAFLMLHAIVSVYAFAQAARTPRRALCAIGGALMWLVAALAFIEFELSGGGAYGSVAWKLSAVRAWLGIAALVLVTGASASWAVAWSVGHSRRGGPS